MLHFAYSDVLLLGFTVFGNMCSMKKNESLKTANVKSKQGKNVSRNCQVYDTRMHKFNV